MSKKTLSLESHVSWWELHEKAHNCCIFAGLINGHNIRALLKPQTSDVWVVVQTGQI